MDKNSNARATIKLTTMEHFNGRTINTTVSRR